MKLKKYSKVLVVLGAMLVLSTLFSDLNLCKIAGEVGGGAMSKVVYTIPFTF